jgi:hypothetical protein
MLGRLDQINEMMPPLDATDEQRQALAAYLATMNKDGGR